MLGKITRLLGLQSADEFTRAHGDLAAMMERYLDDSEAEGRQWWASEISELGKQMLDLSPPERRILTFIALEKVAALPAIKPYHHVHKSFIQSMAIGNLLRELYKRRSVLTVEDAALQLKLVLEAWDKLKAYRPVNPLIKILENHSELVRNEESLRVALSSLRDRLSKGSLWSRPDAEHRKQARMIDVLLTGQVDFVFDNGPEWVKLLTSRVGVMPFDKARAWNRYVNYVSTPPGSKPSKKWLQGVAELIADLGEEFFEEQVLLLLGDICQDNINHRPLLSDVNSNFVRGVVRSVVGQPSSALATAVQELALFSFRKLPNIGAVSTKVGNACLFTLGELPESLGISRLNLLQKRIKYSSARRLIEKALLQAAERTGMSPGDLQDISVPTFELDREGVRRVPLGDFAAEITIENYQPILNWRNAEGRVQRTMPSAVGGEHADTVKSLKKQIKDMALTIAGQRGRFERFYLEDRQWLFNIWRERLLDHSLCQCLSRNLIWSFTDSDRSRSGIWRDGRLQDSAGAPLEMSHENTIVRLWHPIHDSVDSVLAWREFLMSHSIVQPFKQAHREVYLLTDAERTTSVYSNRFAGHILRQHQFSALCQDRGWVYRLQGAFDSHNVPTRTLPLWKLAVEYWVDGLPDDDRVTGSGIFRFVTTDQVRFVREGQGLPLDQVEPIVFSESMRDVDLFVGVCSIGNDPNWQPGALGERYQAYWNDYLAAELSETAKIRTSVLERLVPKLKIADRCKFDGKFLVVKGEYRTYKIHLGSGNILMEPNNQYLCIVEGRGQSIKMTGALKLPFEGDHMMSIILSKAMLLAEDTKIKDPTILSQINR